MDEVLNPRIVGIADRRHAVLPPHIIPQQLAGPVRNVKRRIDEDVIGMQVANEAVVGLLSQIGFDSTNGQIHISRHVMGFDSCPKIEMFRRDPPKISTNRSDCTNIPPEPQQGS